MCWIIAVVVFLWALNKFWQWAAPRLRWGYDAEESEYWIRFEWKKE